MDREPSDLSLSAIIAAEWLADAERLLIFAMSERALADEAETRFRDPITAKTLRRHANAAERLAGIDGDWQPWPWVEF